MSTDRVRTMTLGSTFQQMDCGPGAACGPWAAAAFAMLENPTADSLMAAATDGGADGLVPQPSWTFLNLIPQLFETSR
jgi:hypothetical protein